MRLYFFLNFVVTPILICTYYIDILLYHFKFMLKNKVFNNKATLYKNNI